MIDDRRRWDDVGLCERDVDQTRLGALKGGDGHVLDRLTGPARDSRNFQATQATLSVARKRIYSSANALTSWNSTTLGVPYRNKLE